MSLKSKLFNYFFYLTFFLYHTTNNVSAKEMNASELYASCKNYYNWVIKDYNEPVDHKSMFYMGKCQGIIETIGKTMLTLCYERRRNLNIDNKLTANLEGVKTIEIVEKILEYGSLKTNLRGISSQTYLILLLNKIWPCN